MEPTQTPAAPPTTTSSPGLDPQAVALAKAIRQTESGGNAKAKGASGEFGAYQWEPATWDAMSKAAGVNVPLEQSTLEQQNEVAYKQIKAWKDQGHNVGQIASMWNAGEGAPNAYLQGNVGVNNKGVNYNTPAYAKKVADYYQQFKNQPPQQASKGTSDGSLGGLIPVANAAGTDGTPQPSNSGLVGAAEGVGNFLFPAVKDIYHDITGQNDKTLLQQAGDVGLSALPFIPGLGEAGEAARSAEAVGEGAAAATKGSGLLSKLSASPTAKGALTGYGAGVASNLSQGQGLGQSFMPNASTIGGTVLGGATGALLPKLSGLIGKNATEEGAVNAVQDNLKSELARTVPGRTLLSNLPGGGSKALKLIARVSDAHPTVEGNTFNVEDAISALESRIGQLGRTRAAGIATVAPETSLDELGTAAKAAIMNAPEGASEGEKYVANQRMFSGEASSMSKKIDSIISDIKATTGKDTVNATELEAMKEAQAANSGVYKRTGAIGDHNASSLLAQTAKSKLENLAEGAGFPGLKEYNGIIKDHYDAIKVLQRLGKQTVKGGRLGNMLSGHTAGVVGAVAGNALGGGFLGTIATALGGEGASRLVSKIVGDTTLSNPFRDAILARIAQEDPEVVQQFARAAGREGKTAPVATPKAASKVPGLLNGLLIKGGARAGAAI